MELQKIKMNSLLTEPAQYLRKKSENIIVRMEHTIVVTG
jgi:hypothetical protein